MEILANALVLMPGNGKIARSVMQIEANSMRAERAEVGKRPRRVTSAIDNVYHSEFQFSATLFVPFDRSSWESVARATTPNRNTKRF